MVTLQLHNITFSAMGLERILTWQSLQQQNVWFYKTTEHSRLINFKQRCPYVPMQSEIEKERKARQEIKEKISPPSDPAAVSAGGRGPPGVGGCAPSSWAPLLLYSLGTSCPSSGQGYCCAAQKFSKWVGDCAWGSWWSHNPPCKAGRCLAQALNCLA